MASTREPTIEQCRFAVLPLEEEGTSRYVVYDRLTSRIVDGVYFETPDSALEVAAWFNWHPAQGEKNEIPSDSGLGLIYPK